MRRVTFVAACFALVHVSLADEPKPVGEPAFVRNISVGGRMAEAFAYDPNSKLLVTCGWEYTDGDGDQDIDAWKASKARGVLQLWNPATGDKVAKFDGSAGAMFDVAFSPDGKLVATAGRLEDDPHAGEVKIWDLKARKLKATMKGPKTPKDRQMWELCTAFSADGKFLATGGFDKRAKVWDVQSGELVTTLPDHSSFVQVVQFTRDGKSLMTADRRGGVTLWDTKMWGGKRADFKVEGMFLLDAQISPDEKSIAVAGKVGDAMSGGQISVWGIESKERIALFETGQPSSATAFSPDGKWIAAHGLGRAVRLYNLESAEELSISHSGGSSGEMVQFFPDGRLAFTRRLGLVSLWNMREVEN